MLPRNNLIKISMSIPGQSHLVEQNIFGSHAYRCGLVVRIQHSKCFGPGSNPGTDNFFCHLNFINDERNFVILPSVRSERERKTTSCTYMLLTFLFCNSNNEGKKAT